MAHDAGRPRRPPTLAGRTRRSPPPACGSTSGSSSAREWGEWRQEHEGEPGRRLLHAARLLREPERYAERFGERACELMLADCLWHVYAMIGKLERRIYLLTAA